MTVGSNVIAKVIFFAHSLQLHASTREVATSQPNKKVCKNLHLFVFFPLGTRDSHQHGLRRGPPPLGRLPGAHAAVRRLEEGVGHQGDQHGGVPPPQARPLPPRFHPQRHQRKTSSSCCSSLSTRPRYLVTSGSSSSSASVLCHLPFFT